MRTKRPPLKAEKVYTYSSKNYIKPANRKSIVPDVEVQVNEHFDVARAETEAEASKKAETLKKTEFAQSLETHNAKKDEPQIMAWGSISEETSGFYDKMLEREAGDPKHENPADSGIAKAHKTHSEEIPAIAKTDALNDDHKEESIQKTKKKTNCLYFRRSNTARVFQQRYHKHTYLTKPTTITLCRLQED